MLRHKHLIIRAETRFAPKDEEYINSWLTLIIKHIGMNLAKGLEKNPQSYYCELQGNQGVTGVAILETSHCVVHIWDEEAPFILQFDLYSCSDFAVEDVLPFINLFEPTKVEYKFIDRENDLKITRES